MVLHKLRISQQVSGMQHTYPKVNTWRKTNYIKAQRLQKEDMPQRHNQREKQAIKRYQLKQAIERYQLNQLDRRSYEPHE